MHITKYINKSMVALILLSSSVYANVEVKEKSFIGDGAKFDASKDENDDLHPNIYLPFNWSNTLSTALEYRTSKEITNKKVDGFDGSNNNKILEHKVSKIHILNYNFSSREINYAFGFGYAIEKFDKKELGYADISGNQMDFDNNIDIQTKGFTLKAEATLSNMISNLSGKFSLQIDPKSKLDVKQNTSLNIPSLTFSKQGLIDSSENMDLIYEIKADLLYKTPYFIDFGFESRYQFLPMKYQLKTLGQDLEFHPKEFDVEEKIKYFAVKLLFGAELLDEWSPTVGWSKETTNGRNKVDGDTYSKDEKKVLFGLNKRF